ncbi:MAG: hypothetical protein ACYDCK_15030 [Thermoplasmatota archaeon]
MTGIGALLAVACVSALVSASVAPSSSDARSMVERALRSERDGSLPTQLTISIDGGPARVLDTPQALALVLVVGGSPTLADSSAPPPGEVVDEGVGTRTGPDPCVVAALVTVVNSRVGDVPPPPGLAEAAPTMVVPRSPLQCGEPVPSWTGEASGTLIGSPTTAAACLDLRGVHRWLQGADDHGCSRIAWTHASILGTRVGYRNVQMLDGWGFALTIDQIFGGTNASEAPFGADSAFGIVNRSA